MKRSLIRAALATLCLLSISACTATDPATTPQPMTIVVIGKSVDPYWSGAEAGVIAAGKDFGVKTVFFVPTKEDAAAQIETIETYIAQGVAGIAIAPSDPQALERVMKKAVTAGIDVITLDTPPINNSVARVYIGTDNYQAGRIAGETMSKLLPQGGKVGIVRGSDTALNALQRTEGFLAAIEGTAIQALPPLNDEADVATSLQLTGALLAAHPDLAGAFGVYGYNGLTWTTAIKETSAARRIRVVCFDTNRDTISGILEGLIDATIAQREYDMGYKSVQLLKLMTEKGVEAALAEMGAVDGVIDTGVDVVTAANLKDYEVALDAKGIPHEWHAP